jgi:NAD(P)-dependent dehydrogenase (short-subunit alcohol dehydrogenase family)
VKTRRRVAVVTGGGGGIGAAIAQELGRRGWFVVTVDPLVTLDGSAQLPEPEQTTAGRIVTAGGAARASDLSVTDRDGVRALFEELAAEHGGLDAVVNVAGITRQTGFAHGSEEDWRAVLEVHLGGYLNVLAAALPLMSAAGGGHILGITSGSGWRAADAGAYSCAKRVVAALTWQLGRAAPPDVTVNAMSPIAATRMVAAALERARQAATTGERTGSGGGLSLTSMPGPDDLAPLAADLLVGRFAWCNGQVLFAGGPEIAVVEEPRLLEVVRSDEVTSLAHVVEVVVARAFVSAEAKQATDGGGNPRFGQIFVERSPDAVVSEEVRSCAVVCDRPQLAGSVVAALEERSVRCHRVDVAHGFRDTSNALRSVTEASGPLDAIVWAPAGHKGREEEAHGWKSILEEHERIVEDVHSDAVWARAAADYAADGARRVRLVTLTDAQGAGGRSRAQASAQLARAAAGATEHRVVAFAASLEASEAKSARPAAELVAHLLTRPDSASLAGAELVIGGGWFGIRGHPRPTGSITYGGPAVGDWVDGPLREIVGRSAGASRAESP